jgi:methionyl-tRNA formyltransferase
MAWCEWEGQRFRVLLARALESSELAPGELRAEKRRLLVGTGAGDLELITVQPAGRKPVAGADWARGLREIGRLA